MQDVSLPSYTAESERVRRLETLVYRLLGDYRLGAALLGPLPEAASAMVLRHAGSRYYLSNTLNVRPTLTTGVATADYLYAVPFYVPNVSGIVDRIALEVTTGAAGNVRLGIYSSDRNCYPSELLLDAGAVATTSTGIKTVTVRHGLTRGLKWLAALFDAGPAVRKHDVSAAGAWSPLGVDPSTWDFHMGWYKAFGYAALPSKFPSGGTSHSWAPVLMLRFAA